MGVETGGANVDEAIIFEGCCDGFVAIVRELVVLFPFDVAVFRFGLVVVGVVVVIFGFF